MNINGGGIILLYHGVTDAPSQGVENFSGKHIRADEFERQMSWIANHANPMTFRDMAERLEAGEALPENSVCVTFDDGYRNNHDVALPILKRYEVPATFFISTGFIGESRLFWTDKVEHLINHTGKAVLEITVPSGQWSYEITDEASRIYAISDLKADLKRLPPQERDEVIETLRSVSGNPGGWEDVPNYQTLSWEQLHALDAPPRYEVGGHSVNHEILAYLDRQALVHEVAQSLASLGEAVGRKVDLFSYPEGGVDHYDENVIDVLKAHGVVHCPSAQRGTNPPGSDSFHFKRIMVGFMGEPFPLAEYAQNEMAR